MSDNLVKRLRDPSLGSPRWMGTMAEGADRIEAQTKRIAELEAALAAARREGMEDAARWHDEQAAQAQKLADMKVSAHDAKVWSDYAENHREYAAAIRAAAGEEK